MKTPPLAKEIRVRHSGINIFLNFVNSLLKETKSRMTVLITQA
jgi:hypothetical protein